MSNTIKVAAIGDLHIQVTNREPYRELFKTLHEKADLLFLCGDLTDHGLMEEAVILAEELSFCQIPVVGVLGNHDYESDKQTEISTFLREKGIIILEGTEYIFEKKGRKIGITGVKGFGGGFHPYMWGHFGEKEQKAFYNAIETEVQNLEIGLNTLQQQELQTQIVLLHFSPIRQTVVGDIIEMYPFLGSSRLEEVIDRYEHVKAVFHGHSHHGTAEGRTEKNIPVCNASQFVQKKLHEDTPFALVEI